MRVGGARGQSVGALVRKGRHCEVAWGLIESVQVACLGAEPCSGSRARALVLLLPGVVRVRPQPPAEEPFGRCWRRRVSFDLLALLDCEL